MKDILNVYSISGLFYELYYPDVGAFTCDRLDTNHANPLQRTNALFWADLLSKSNLERLIEHMKEEQQDESRVGNIERAVLANPHLFIGLIEKAVTAIVDQSISEVQMFAYMEQIEIACKLLSKYLYAPFTLSIQDGFQEPTLSAKARFSPGFFRKEWDSVNLLLVYSVARLRRRRLACPRNGRPSGTAVSLQAFARSNTIEPA